MEREGNLWFGKLGARLGLIHLNGFEKLSDNFYQVRNHTPTGLIDANFCCVYFLAYQRTDNNVV